MEEPPMLLSGDRHTTPRYPAYLMPRSIAREELAAAAEAAVARVGGRGALGPLEKGAKVLIVSADDQDGETLAVIEEAMRGVGVVSVRHVTWSSIGLPTGDYSAADGWRELSEERLESVIRSGERVEQDALKRLLAKDDDYTHIYAGDAGEGHYKLAIGDRFRANWMYRKREDLLARYTNFPVEIQRLLERKLVQSFSRAGEVRITDPEGTDIGWNVTAEEAKLWTQGSWIPWHIIGTTIEAVRLAQVRPSFGGSKIDSIRRFAPIAARHYPGINGVVSGTVNHTGFYPRMTVRVEAGRVASIEGGGEYGDRFKEIVERFSDVQYPGYPAPGYHFLNDATIGSNPKTFRSIESLWNTAIPWIGGGNERYRAGVIHFGFGAEHDDPEFIKFGREHKAPVKHMPHIHSYFPTYEIKDRETGEWFKVVERGRLTVLEDPAVRRLAALIANPDELLAYDWVPAIPGINHPGDYARDYAPDPVAWIRRDVAGEFGRPVA
jgi:hypothetical protein